MSDEIPPLDQARHQFHARPSTYQDDGACREEYAPVSVVGDDLDRFRQDEADACDENEPDNL